MNRSGRSPVGIVGTGRLARALAASLADARWPVSVVVGRRRSAIDSVKRLAPGARGTTSYRRAAEAADILLFAVADRAIEPVARKFADCGVRLAGKTALHHAGALGPEELEPLRREDVSVGVLHPLQTLGGGSRQHERLRGCRARVEGDPHAVRVARRLARALGVIPLDRDGAWDSRDRARYHAAASLVSNDVVALFAIAVELLESSGLAHDEAIAALLPLATGTLIQLEDAGLSGAMTGPVVRGDFRTLAAHLDDLPADAAEIHRRLSRALLDAFERTGAKLSKTERDGLRRVLATPRGGRRRGPRV